ncbi:hypothetical protein LTR66_008279 [Elasticomyces elasticus]|nr:hypothetical protein LTR66_008279 [Elasticomyces elasticus]
MAITAVVQTAAHAGKEIQTRQRTNSFLDHMNDEFFRPRGLYALIVKYKPDAAKALSAERLDLSKTVVKYGESSADPSTREKIKGLRVASGTTYDDLEMPEAAPLVFSALDATVASTGEVSSKEKAKSGQKFVAQYLDRRAQANYDVLYLMIVNMPNEEELAAARFELGRIAQQWKTGIDSFIPLSNLR